MKFNKWALVMMGFIIALFLAWEFGHQFFGGSLSIAPNPVVFNPAGPAQLTVFVSAHGRKSFTISSIAIDPKSEGNEFQLVSSQCTGKTLVGVGPVSGCSFVLQDTPALGGAAQATLEVWTTQGAVYTASVTGVRPIP